MKYLVSCIAYALRRKAHVCMHDTRFKVHDTQRGFTLIETMVAITLLTIAIVAPMSLTTQSLTAAYYARDQITAFHLAQEAVESVRHVRDHNVLLNALGTRTDLLAGIPSTDGSPFTIDTRTDTMNPCEGGVCPPLQTNLTKTFYGYDPTWTDTLFTRTVRAAFLKNADGSDNTDEVRVSVTVSWKTGAYQTRSFAISTNLYRWVNDGSGALQ